MNSVFFIDFYVLTKTDINYCFALYSVYCILYTVFCILYSVFCILYSVFCFLYSVFCILYSAFCILYFAFFIPYSVFCIMCPVFCTLYSVFCIMYSVFCILYSVFCILYSVSNLRGRTQIWIVFLVSPVEDIKLNKLNLPCSLPSFNYSEKIQETKVSIHTLQFLHLQTIYSV